MPESVVAQASRLIASGAIADGIAVLTNASHANDVDALMQLAVWHLIGHPVPRDLTKARALLRRTVKIGHVDAALMEIALTANGSGGTADWPGAITLLETAARNDPVAAHQRGLLSTMTLAADGSPLYLPPAEKLSRSPNVWLIHQFFSPAECAHVADVATPLLAPAEVIDPINGRRIAHPVRTSHDGAIGPAREDLIIRALNHRIAAISGTTIDQGEPLTVLRYSVGQQYRPHVDTLPGAGNQRIKTMLIYLNQGYGGGMTQFIANGMQIDARAGDAVMFDNVRPDGTPDSRSQHAGLPVTSGSKWLATRWIRAGRYDPWTGA